MYIAVVMDDNSVLLVKFIKIIFQLDRDGGAEQMHKLEYLVGHLPLKMTAEWALQVPC